jgi:hypothetical protein
LLRERKHARVRQRGRPTGRGFFGTPQNPIAFVRACTGQTTIGNPAHNRICSWKVYISNIIFALNAAYGTGNGRIYSITPK